MAINDIDTLMVGDVDKELQDQQEPKTCLPLVSEYTDCTPANECTGCTKCVCSAAGQWECKSLHQCEAFQTDKIDEELFDAAVDKLEYELKETQKQAIDRWKGPGEEYTPQPEPKRAESDELLGILNSYNERQKLKQLGNRRQKRAAVKKSPTENKQDKRSVDKVLKKIKPVTNVINNTNQTIKFHSTTNELNEDTMAHSNVSGTLHARRVELNVPVAASRRSEDNSNKSLHIDFNQPKMYSHITDNKIDTEHEIKVESHEKQLNLMLGNHSQKEKDKELSKLVVNELKAGSEVIGDKNAPVTSNITFTVENDTLTAMAFIAGNLLNKLWNMEKDATESSWETDNMKQEKIADLLDLFKEPLNLRQEAFLKNALHHLSSAIDKHKDIKNVSLCETIEEAKKFVDDSATEEEENISINPTAPVDETKLRRKISEAEGKKNKQEAAVRAISKINKVLGLIKKYENVQRNLSLLKYGSDLRLNDTDNYTSPISEKLIVDTLLTRDESYSLNMYGSILDKITKLLLPKSSYKAMASELKQKHSLGTDKNFKSHLKNNYGINIQNMTISAKDKLVLDYIEHLNSNPDCRRGKKAPSKSLPVIEGNILLNLSEFFKLKSFTDLVNMLHPEKKVSRELTTTQKPTASPTEAANPENKNKLTSTKEKLKAHLKSIIEDLIELQNAKGIKPKSNIRIADALPCIYNIMNAGKEMSNKNVEQSGPGKIVDIFNGLKHDMKVSQYRRSDTTMRIRPKSAIVLERVLQNFVEKSDLKTRRFLDIEVKPIDELKYLVNKMKNVSSIYKNQALMAEVPAADKLVLFKALAEDVKHYIAALEQIKVAFQNVSELSTAQFNDLAKFIVNSIQNITLNAKVLKKLEKSRKHVIEPVDTEPLPERAFSALSRSHESSDDNMVISRNQIINHLIRNRMRMFMKLREGQVYDVNSDLNYNIAKKILFYLDNGNDLLAHELFRALILQKHVDLGARNEFADFTTPQPPKLLDIPIRQDGISHIKPLIQFEEPKVPTDQMKWMNQDHLIKQLLNIKNMGL